MVRENGRKHGFGGSDLTKEQTEAQNEARKRGGQASFVRDMPPTTCPICRARDVRLVWIVAHPKSVRYEHKRFCKGGDKSGQKSCKIDAEGGWRELLGALTDEQFEAHKEDVLREFQRLDNTC